MNKVLNINLGGFPFTIDEDAYNHLHHYLQTIHNHFRSSDGYEEITNDIETRLAELLRERLSSHTIVHLKDVTAVIAIMGTPADFGADPDTPRPNNGQRLHKTGKRLFRHPDDTVLGGVCAGIAAYLGIQDPLWIRLAFIAFFFFGGFAIPLYIILWIIVPKAESASDRLAMRGDPVNANNIGKIIEEELSHVSRKVSELGDELKAEFKSSGANRQNASEQPGTPSSGIRSIRNAIQEMLRLVGAVLLAVLNFLRKAIKPIAFAIGLTLVVSLGIAWIGLVAGTFIGSPFLAFILPASPVRYALGVVNILAIIGIPLLMLILGVMRLFMRTHFKPRWVLGLWIFWGLNILSVSLLSSAVLRDFQSSTTTPPSSQKSFSDIDTLSIEMVDAYSDLSFLHFGDKLRMADGNLLSRHISLSIQQSDTDDFQLLQSNFARGKDAVSSAANANAIRYNWRIHGNKLLLDDAFSIPDGNLWRGQKVNLTLKVPINKRIAFDRNTRPFVGSIALDRDKPTPDRHERSNFIWQMGPNGLFAPDFSGYRKD